MSVLLINVSKMLTFQNAVLLPLSYPAERTGMIRHIYCGYSAALRPSLPGINSLSGNSSVIRPLFFARELHRLFESVFSRAGEQSVTFGGKDEQRRERTPFFVKKRSKLLIACSGLVRLMGLSAQISFVPRSKERSAGAFCPASSPQINGKPKRYLYGISRSATQR